MIFRECSDDGVPRKAIGCFDVLEDANGVVKVTVGRVVGECAEAEDFGRCERVVNAGRFDHVGLNLLQVSHGFAGPELWEEGGRVWRSGCVRFVYCC